MNKSVLAPKITSERCYYVDWLRVLAMLVIFLFHCARFFDHGGWHVKNVTSSIGFSIFTGFTHQWTMPFFFLLSGAGTWFALKAKDQSQYIGARLKRLLIPYFFGIILFIPPQKYLEAIFYNRFNGSFLAFMPHYFNPDTLWIDGSFRFFGYYGYHLWFLGFLFVFSLIMLPLFMFLKKEPGHGLFSKMKALCYRPGGIFLTIMPVAVIQIFLRPLFRDYLHWADFFYWLIFFFYGYLFFSDERIQQVIEKYRKLAFWLAIISTSLIMVWFLAGNLRAIYENPDYSIGSILFQIMRSMNTWAWILFFLGIGRRHLNFTNNFLKYSNKGVLPFYILHQTVILIIGFYIIQWDISMMVKYIIITAASFIVIMVLYELIKPLNPTRFVFGMKMKVKSKKKTPFMRVQPVSSESPSRH